MKPIPSHPPEGHTSFYRFFSTGFFLGILLAAFLVAQDLGTDWIARPASKPNLQANSNIRYSPSNAELQALLSRVETTRSAEETGTRHKLEAPHKKSQNRLPASAL